MATIQHRRLHHARELRYRRVRDRQIAACARDSQFGQTQGAGDDAAIGDREIIPAEAEVIRRIFRDYAAGVSPKALAKRLNAERCQGPAGAQWNPSTIHGNSARGTGILNNELYVGRLVWNRLRYIKDPDTGKRVSRKNAPSEWVQVEMRRVASNGDPKRFNQARRPKYRFSGLKTCARAVVAT